MGELPLYHQTAGPQPVYHPPALDQHAYHVNYKVPEPVGEEEDYTIKCICDFQEDDGHTALCEQCNTWQHVDCYYFPDHNVPDVHQCVDCFKRPLPTGAAERQRRRRDTQNANEERKAKRSGPKAHKKLKSGREPTHPNGVHTNGWSPSDEPHDHTGGSPRDHPPPFKKTKTHHRNSQSTSLSHHNGKRERHLSTFTNDRPLLRPPLAECPPDYYSPDFIQAHQDDSHFPLVGPEDSNEWSRLEVATEFSRWLDDPAVFEEKSDGRKQGEVFQRTSSMDNWDWPVEKRTHQDDTVHFHGSHPVWPHLIANKHIDQGRFIGELIGTIGDREEYMRDPQNQWDRLRHPDHFVFFHPYLPIVLDCRRRGSLMRYLRRSCYPNAILTTLVTGERDFHFCFVASQPIAEGEEITVAWNTQLDERLHEALNIIAHSQHTGHLGQRQREYITQWAGTILAHFGGCACESQLDARCLLAQFDNRLWPNGREASPSKHMQTSQTSPIGIRTGKERHVGASTGIPDEYEMEAEDRRSSARSSRSRTSRDATPNALGSPRQVNGRSHETSERDRKKILQTARLFEKIDHDRHKKKRRSGSSNVNTALPSNLKPQSRSKSSASDPNTPALKSKRRSNENGSYFSAVANMSAQETSGSISPSERASPSTSGKPPIRPVYTDAGVQTEPKEAFRHPPLTHNTQRRPYVPLSQRMLQRLHHSRKARQGLEADKVHEEQGEGNTPLGLPPSDVIGAEPYAVPKADSHDIEMETPTDLPPSLAEPLSPPKSPLPDADTRQEALRIPSPATTKLSPPQVSDLGVEAVESQTSPSTIYPPRAPLSESPSRQVHQRPNNLHVDLPLPQFARPGSSDASAGSSNGLSFSDNATRSPQVLAQAGGFAAPVAPMSAPILNNVTSSLTQPSPVRKKMSLSDYSQRLKAKTPVLEKSQSTGQPGYGSSPGSDAQDPGTPLTKQPAPNAPRSNGSEKMDESVS